MKIYLAGIYTSNFDKVGTPYSRLDEVERKARDSVAHYLESYHYIKRQSYVRKIQRDGVKVFLDSGAFSAFTKGVNVDIDAYCDYIKANKDIIEVVDGTYCASVLDGIGDPLKTWQNQHYMESKGATPLPCFHYGEDERFLEWYVERYPYITLGGMVPISTPQLILWLDRIWETYLTDGEGKPKLKVHGFGLTSVPLMERYPWYSVDSSSWVQIAANGGIMVPDIGMVAISENSPNRKKFMAHLRTLPPPARSAIEQELLKSGFDLERLATEYVSRWGYNCYSFAEINKKMNQKSCTFNRPQIGLFN